MPCRNRRQTDRCSTVKFQISGGTGQKKQIDSGSVNNNKHNENESSHSTPTHVIFVVAAASHMPLNFISRHFTLRF